jgi:cell division protein FtsB
VSELAEARARIFELEKSLRASEAEGEALAQEVARCEAEICRLREGLAEALRQLEADRYIITRNVLRGVISGETW